MVTTWPAEVPATTLSVTAFLGELLSAAPSLTQSQSSFHAAVALLDAALVGMADSIADSRLNPISDTRNEMMQRIADVVGRAFVS